MVAGAPLAQGGGGGVAGARTNMEGWGSMAGTEAQGLWSIIRVRSVVSSRGPTCDRGPHTEGTISRAWFVIWVCVLWSVVWSLISYLVWSVLLSVLCSAQACGQRSVKISGLRSAIG